VHWISCQSVAATGWGKRGVVGVQQVRPQHRPQHALHVSVHWAAFHRKTEQDSDAALVAILLLECAQHSLLVMTLQQHGIRETQVQAAQSEPRWAMRIASVNEFKRI
jgi:hypothetical protein